MNTTYTYIHTDKSLNRNQVFSCCSSSREAESQTPSMWLKGRETGPINPHVPYLAITASDWPLVTALQQHNSPAIVLVGEVVDEPFHKTGARWAEAIQVFPICFSTTFHQSRLTMPWKNQQEVYSLKPMQWVDTLC